ncbi:hypothetical protein [Nocardia arthritidis]|uniref:hypothetical protein n=1 Tax=Nocardia arthritidis TaxID=228602 RepID=UPI000B1D70E0|nr:hypothetical protein [Nocardia arthritidis]
MTLSPGFDAPPSISRAWVCLRNPVPVDRESRYRLGWVVSDPGTGQESVRGGVSGADSIEIRLVGSEVGVGYLDDGAQDLMRRRYRTRVASVPGGREPMALLRFQHVGHRPSWDDVSTVPAPRRNEYREFPPRLKCDKLAVFITSSGYRTEPDNDATTTDIRRCRVSESGVRYSLSPTLILIGYADVGAEDPAERRVDEVWPVVLSLFGGRREIRASTCHIMMPIRNLKNRTPPGDVAIQDQLRPRFSIRTRCGKNRVISW